MEVDKYQTLGEHWSFHIKAKEIRDMPKIPVNIDNLPTEVDPLDEGIMYHGVCRSCQVADTTDRNGILI